VPPATPTSVHLPQKKRGDNEISDLDFGVEAMLTLFVLPLILAFAPAAVWALRAGGPRWLWLLGAFALLALILAALVLSAVYSVPGVWRVVLYFLVFVGPSVLFTNAALTVAGAFERALWTQLITALVGCLVGLAVGFVVAVYGLGV
jgi:hypothetical protein